MGREWERRPKESAVAFEAFALYRDLGDKRSLREVARRLSKSKSLIERWARRHAWTFRTDAWDARLAYAEAKTAEKAAVSQVEREAATRAKTNIRIARYATGAALMAVHRLFQQLRDDPSHTLGVGSTAQLVEVAERSQRLIASPLASEEDGETAQAVERLLVQLRRVRERTAAKAE